MNLQWTLKSVMELVNKMTAGLKIKIEPVLMTLVVLVLLLKLELGVELVTVPSLVLGVELVLEWWARVSCLVLGVELVLE